MTETEKALKLLQLFKASNPDIDWKSIAELTPEQIKLVEVLIKQQVEYAMDEGMALAIEMIRLSPPHFTKDEIANLIESSIHEHQ